MVWAALHRVLGALRPSIACSRSGSKGFAPPLPVQYLAAAARPPPRATLRHPATRLFGTDAMAAADLPPRAQNILDYWFGEGWETAGADDNRPEKSRIWYSGAPEVDAEIVASFLPDCEALLEGRYDGWGAAQPQATLAGILLGDQLFRNAFRGTAKMYAGDGRALGWAKALMASGTDKGLKPIQRVFVYMPLMHSEELADQEECVSRFQGLLQDCEAAGLSTLAKMATETVKYARAHRDVVAKWGRFPHRNTILGRASTPEEAAGIAAGTIPKW